jgi:uncharacterized protein (DUF305 family)
MRTSRATAAVILAAVLVAVCVVGCVACGRSAHRVAPAAGQATSGQSTLGQATFGGTDVAWIQLMIPMTAQADSLLELTAHRASDVGLAELAAQLRAGYRDELRRLRAALVRAGLTPTHEHDGHDLPGMITAADLASLGGRTGAGFDADAVRQLREEMEQSVRLARSEQQAGRNGDCMMIAASIERARTSALRRLSAVIRA